MWPLKSMANVISGVSGVMKAKMAAAMAEMANHGENSVNGLAAALSCGLASCCLCGLWPGL
jgi:hypothetical protein